MVAHCGQKAGRSTLHSDEFEDPWRIVVEAISAGELVEEEQTNGLVLIRCCNHRRLTVEVLKHTKKKRWKLLLSVKTSCRTTQ